MDNSTLALLVSLASALIALGSIIASVYFWKKSCAQNADRNFLMEKSWVDNYFNAVRNWGSEVCAIISQAIHYVETIEDESEPANVLEIRQKLSELLDRGRWLYPNQYEGEIGQHKPPAYRGLRQPILDHVFEAYKLMSGELDQVNLKSKLTHVQREFVSEIQQTLDPRKRVEQIDMVINKFSDSEKLWATQ